jgi:hypothetical protein
MHGFHMSTIDTARQQRYNMLVGDSATLSDALQDQRVAGDTNSKQQTVGDH